MTAERSPRRIRVAALVIVLGAACTLARGDDLTPSEQRGKRIYTEGKGDAPISALLGYGDAPVAASAVPCASCHGADGHGRAEGGVEPADITPAALAAKPVPYTARTLRRAVTMGIDPAGRHLNPTMPRFAMASRDMDALDAYLKKVGDTRDPGLTATTIRLGVLLPPREHLPEAHDAVRRALEAFAAARNRDGGVFDRRLELLFADCEGSPAARAAAAAKFLDEQQPFALVASFTDGADGELAAVAESHRTPLLATISSHARFAPRSRYVRDLVAGLEAQARAMAVYIGRHFPSGRVALLHERDDHSRGIAEAAAEELRGAGVKSTMAESSTSAAALKEQGVDVVLFAGAAASLPPLLAGAREIDWRPSVFVSSSLLHPEALDRSRTTARLYVALPIGPDDQSPEAIAAWQKLVGDDGARMHRPSQFAALASAELLVAALEHAGRDLTRDKFLDAIDGITALRTGLVPPLTYTPTRHLGSTGAYIVAVTDASADGPPIVWIDPG